jgi:hypothetical protein
MGSIGRGHAHQHGHLLESDAARRLFEHESRYLHGFERLAGCREESDRAVERRRRPASAAFSKLGRRRQKN